VAGDGVDEAVPDSALAASVGAGAASDEPPSRELLPDEPPSRELPSRGLLSEGSPPADPPADEPSADLERARLVDDRSFFAQPEPLKWTAGLTSAFRIVASSPHAGQNRGPVSLIRWITSIRCRQDVQT
jgi:hypothetical protein